MATTIKNFISTDSPQYEEHITTIKVQILQNFLKCATFKTHFCRPFFGQPRLFLTLGVTVLNTINTHEFHPSIIPGSKFKIPSQYFVVTSLAFLNSCQLLIFLHAALLA